MEIYKHQTGDLFELRIAGRLDGYWADHLTEALDEVVRGGAHHVRLDLSETSFLSSAGIRVLVQFYKQLRSIEGSFQVIRPAEGIRKVLEMAGLKAILAGNGPAAPSAPVGAAPAASITTLERPNATLQVHTLGAGSALACRLLGKPDLLLGSRFSEQDCRRLTVPAGSMALGLGALGNHFADCQPRFGEFLALAGCVAYQPADGAGVPDYSVSEGSFVPEVQCLYGVQCTGSFSHLARFEAKPEPRSVSLDELVETALDIAGSPSAGIVVLGETLGLVGAALKRAPTRASEDRETPFRHPQIRDWLSFTVERAFPRSISVVMGIATRNPQGPVMAFVRPLHGKSDVRAHLHAAAFSYAPLQKGVIDLHATVTGLFATQSLQGVLHLVNDDREIAGAGQSAFFRGACWIAPLDRIVEETE